MADPIIYTGIRMGTTSIGVAKAVKCKGCINHCPIGKGILPTCRVTLAKVSAGTMKRISHQCIIVKSRSAKGTGIKQGLLLSVGRNSKTRPFKVVARKPKMELLATRQTPTRTISHIATGRRGIAVTVKKKALLYRANIVGRAAVMIIKGRIMSGATKGNISTVRIKVSSFRLRCCTPESDTLKTPPKGFPTRYFAK